MIAYFVVDILKKKIRYSFYSVNRVKNNCLHKL